MTRQIMKQKPFHGESFQSWSGIISLTAAGQGILAAAVRLCLYFGSRHNSLQSLFREYVNGFQIPSHKQSVASSQEDRDCLWRKGIWKGQPKKGRSLPMMNVDVWQMKQTSDNVHIIGEQPFSAWELLILEFPGQENRRPMAKNWN